MYVLFCLAGDADIIQLSAVCADHHEFNTYVMPSKPSSTTASQVTHIRIVNSQLTYRGVNVQSLPLEIALSHFINWLEEIHEDGAVLILIGHNVKTFDCRYLIRSLNEHVLTTRFAATVGGFVDTLPLLKEIHPGRRKFSKESLVRDI